MNEEIADQEWPVVERTVKAAQPGALVFTPGELRDRDERIINETLRRAHRWEDGEASPDELLFKYENIIAAIEGDANAELA